MTGGANGIGRALCLRFAKEGANFIVVSDVDEANGKAVADEIEKGCAGFFPCDVSQEAEVKSLVESVSSAAGQVDIFCSNAGIAVAGDRNLQTSNGSAVGKSTQWRTFTPHAPYCRRCSRAKKAICCKRFPPPDC